MDQALCEILRQENYEVDHWWDGVKGQYAIETGVYDVVILDVMLPGKNGFDITREVRKKRDPDAGPEKYPFPGRDPDIR